jgi:hypothetical protein
LRSDRAHERFPESFGKYDTQEDLERGKNALRSRARGAYAALSALPTWALQAYALTHGLDTAPAGIAERLRDHASDSGSTPSRRRRPVHHEMAGFLR